MNGHRDLIRVLESDDQLRLLRVVEDEGHMAVLLERIDVQTDDALERIAVPDGYGRPLALRLMGDTSIVVCSGGTMVIDGDGGAFGCQLIKMRRLDVAALKAKAIRPLLVGNQEKEVGLFTHELALFSVRHTGCAPGFSPGNIFHGSALCRLQPARFQMVPKQQSDREGNSNEMNAGRF